MTSQTTRVESDAWMAMVDTMREIESRKREYAPGSPEFLGLAQRVEELAKIVFGISQRQLAASEWANRSGTESAPTLETTPVPASLAQVIDEWRGAERRLAFAPQDSDEEAVARAEVAALRSAYHAGLERMKSAGSGSSDGDRHGYPPVMGLTEPR